MIRRLLNALSPAPTLSDAARAMSAERVAQQRRKVIDKARQIRRECGMPPSPALEG